MHSKATPTKERDTKFPHLRISKSGAIALFSANKTAVILHEPEAHVPSSSEELGHLSSYRKIELWQYYEGELTLSND